MRKWLLTPLLGFALLGLSGCSTLGFYSQAINGQLALMRDARPVQEVIGDPAVKEVVRDRLRVAQAARRFSRTELKLPRSHSYESYVDVGRSAVVWNVIAAPTYSVKPHQWCYPIAGCVGYRGYFARADADRYAEELRRDGYDVCVAGATAYSTLGWFNDPIVSTMLRHSEQELVATIFHEMAHQQLYVSGDDAFNEAFAVTVADEGVRRWYRDNPELYQQYLRDEQRLKAVTGLLLSARAQLAALYARPVSDEQKAAGKRAVMDDLHARYEALKAPWHDDGFDGWVPPEVNNAHLALVSTYQSLVPAFRELLAREQGDLAGFYAAAATIGRLPPAERRARLAALSEPPDLRAAAP